MKQYKLFFFGLFLMFSLGSCDRGSDAKGQEIGNPEVQPLAEGNRVVYELNVRNYSSKGFTGVKEDLPRLKELGVDVIWLMPIHPIGEVNRNGTLGSPYAVKDYKEVNPEFGTKADFKALVEEAHRLNMEIMLDWVANHTAWDHPWATEHIDYYSYSSTGERPYSPEGWLDVIELNFDNPQMRAEMIDAMKYWVEEFDIDGYRCDAVVFTPVDFWKQARAAIDPIKKITWLAEGDKPEYMAVFDYDYAWEFSNQMTRFGTGSEIGILKSASQALYNDPTYTDKGRLIYLTNHDINSHENTEFTRFGANVLPMTVFYFTIYDLPLIYNGQEVGMNKMMSLFNYDPVLWEPKNKIFNSLFEKLTYLRRTHPALESGKNRGSLKFIETSHPKVLAYSRTRGQDEIVVVLNFGSVASKFFWTGAVPSGTYTELLSDQETQFSKAEGLILMEKGYSIYVKK